ncbi:DNA polymerase III subunit delta [Shouchella clausii]|uniref:DNA polymerase III subunit delta n=1 Tax=Shouchella clausii TaxID=79880 RepID=UPI000BA6DD66|nr:DNA polymerase III subunit delta [Shouchella clausii]PAD90814.1 DNA polymerase III subunit delta [Shouchella clausii]
MSIITEIKQLSSETMAPVYFLYGTERYLIEQFLQKASEALFAGEEGEMNDIRFRLQDTPLGEVVEEAETVPFFSTRKLVVIQDFYLATSQKVATKLEHDISALEAYLDSPAQETVLVVVAPYEKLDERKKITKKLKKQTSAIDVNPLDEKETFAWMEAIAKQEGVAIEQDAKQLLYKHTGPNLMLLHRELEKCMLYGEDGDPVTASIVDELVAETVEQSVFTVIDYTAKGRAGDAVRLYHQLLRQKEEPLAILALLTRQFRQFFQVKTRLAKGYTQKEMASQLKLHPYVVKLAMQQVKALTTTQLRQALIVCEETDYAIKTGQADKELAVELLLLRLAST